RDLRRAARAALCAGALRARLPARDRPRARRCALPRAHAGALLGDRADRDRADRRVPHRTAAVAGDPAPGTMARAGARGRVRGRREPRRAEAQVSAKHESSPIVQGTYSAFPRTGWLVLGLGWASAST